MAAKRQLSDQKLLTYLTAGLIVILPLAASRSFFWFEITLRVLLLQLFAVIGLTIILSSAVAKRRLVVPKHQAHLFLVGYIFFALVSTAASIHRTTSIYGLPGKSEGLVTLGLLSLAFWCVAVMVSRDRSAKMFIAGAMVASAGIVALLSLMDFAMKGFNPNAINYGPIYNRTLLGAYLAGILPISLALAVGGPKSNKFLSKSSQVAAVAIFMALAASLSRAAWLSGLSTTILFIAMSAAHRRDRLKQVGLIIVGSVIVLGILLTVKPGIPSYVFSRAQAGVQFDQGNWITRLEMWKSAGEITKNRPLFGSGPDTLAYSYPKAATKRLLVSEANFYADDIRTKDVHNYPLQVAATLGLPALVLFLAFSAKLVQYGLRKIKLAGNREKTEDQLLLLGFVLAIGGLMIALLLTPGNIILLTMLWISFGVIAGTTSIGIRAIEIPSPTKARLAALTVGILAIAAAGFMLVVRPAVADYYLQNSFGDDYYADLSQIDQAISWMPNSDILHRQRAELSIRIYRISRDPNMLKLAVAGAAKAVKTNPVNPYNYYYLAKLQMEAGKTGAATASAPAPEALTKAIALFPLYPEAHLELAKIYLQRREYPAARRELELTRQVSPSPEADFLLRKLNGRD